MPICIPEDNLSVYYISILIYLNRTLLTPTTPYGNFCGCTIHKREHSDPTAFQGLLRLITDSKQEKTLISQHFLMDIGISILLILFIDYFTKKKTYSYSHWISLQLTVSQWSAVLKHTEFINCFLMSHSISKTSCWKIATQTTKTSFWNAF